MSAHKDIDIVYKSVGQETKNCTFVINNLSSNNKINYNKNLNKEKEFIHHSCYNQKIIFYY